MLKHIVMLLITIIFQYLITSRLLYIYEFALPNVLIVITTLLIVAGKEIKWNTNKWRMILCMRLQI